MKAPEIEQTHCSSHQWWMVWNASVVNAGFFNSCTLNESSRDRANTLFISPMVDGVECICGKCRVLLFKILMKAQELGQTHCSSHHLCTNDGWLNYTLEMQPALSMYLTKAPEQEQTHNPSHQEVDDMAL